jgi:hypothetical protein
VTFPGKGKKLAYLEYGYSEQFSSEVWARTVRTESTPKQLACMTKSYRCSTERNCVDEICWMSDAAAARNRYTSDELTDLTARGESVSRDLQKRGYCKFSLLQRSKLVKRERVPDLIRLSLTHFPAVASGTLRPLAFDSL